MPLLVVRVVCTWPSWLRQAERNPGLVFLMSFRDRCVPGHDCRKYDSSFWRGLA